MQEMPETYLKVLGFWKTGELEFTLDFIGIRRTLLRTMRIVP